MADGTAIEWCDATWPVVAGCTRVSPACDHCYAIRDSWRLGHNPNVKVRAAYEGTVKRRPDGGLDWSGMVRCLGDRMAWPLRWRKPRRIFVCNESDLWHASVPRHFIDLVFAVVAATPRHTYLTLTKRADRMAEYLCDPATPRRIARVTGKSGAFGPLVGKGDNPGALGAWVREGAVPWPLPNLHVGVTAESHGTAEKRVPALLRTPAYVRFISIEPMLGPPVNLNGWLLGDMTCGSLLHDAVADDSGDCCAICGEQLSYEKGLIDWVICGAETGPGKRPMHLDWARSLRDQCQAANVPFFFKRDSNGSTLLDGQEWRQLPRVAP